MKLPIRWQLTGMICFLIFLVLGTTLSVIQPFISRDYEAKITQSNAAIADSMALNISQYMNNSSIILKSVAEYPQIMRLSYTSQRKILAKVIERAPQFEMVAILDLKGNEIVHSAGKETYRGNRPWFRQFVKEGKDSISPVYYSVFSKRPVFTIMQGIYENNYLVGMVMADVEIHDLQDYVGHYAKDGGSSAYLFDGTGMMIARPEEGQVLELLNYLTKKKQQPVYQKDRVFAYDEETGGIQMQESDFAVPDSLQLIVQKVLAGNRGTGTYEDLEKQKYLCAYQAIPLRNLTEQWGLIVVQKRSTAMAFMEQVMANSFLIGMCILFLAGGAVFYFSRRITRPIEEMAAAARHIENGDLSVYVPVREKSEIGMLAERFNFMIAGLRAYRQEQRQTQNRIQAMAYHDRLTGLPNRARLEIYLQDLLAGRIAGQERCGTLLFVDLDNFKIINDTFGHAMGDKILVEASLRLQEAAGEKAFVCRLGGDEFVIIFPEKLDEEEVQSKVEKIILYVNQGYCIDDKCLNLSASVGISFFPEDGEWADDLLKKADGAMYQAKNAGGNRWYFYEEEENK